MVAAVAPAGNVLPYVHLEVYQYSQQQDPAPAEVCLHQERGEIELQCYCPKSAYAYAFVPIHVTHLNLPICSTVGPACADSGGYTGIELGLHVSGTAVTFLSAVACSGFSKLPSTASEPGAISFVSTSLCHASGAHPGYVVYYNASTKTTATYFDITSNADTGQLRVLNCEQLYDPWTAINGRAQWGGTRTIVCSIDIDVEPSTWGKIKALYR